MFHLFFDRVLTTRYHYTYAIPTVASLVGLWVLHLIWSYMVSLCGAGYAY